MAGPGSQDSQGRTASIKPLMSDSKPETGTSEKGDWRGTNPDGTYSLQHTWQVEATLDGREFACWVVQDEQPPVQANITLRAQASRRGKGGCSLLPAPLSSQAGKVRYENTCRLPGMQTAVGQGLKAARDEGEGREDALGL